MKKSTSNVVAGINHDRMLLFVLKYLQLYNDRMDCIIVLEKIALSFLITGKLT